MRLSEGKITAAYGAIRSALAGTDDRWARARMLPAQVEIAIAAGDPATARASAEELGEISAAYDSPALLASKHDSSGRVLLAEGDSGWHDDALRAVFVGNGGEVVNSTGDGFFVAFDSASSAITCAMAVQRALAEQRRTHGFAPAVRIGLHSAVATRRGSDYSGKDVHVAARIAALARGGEIMASSATAAMAGFYPATETRVVRLKGVSADVEVVSITWN
jgi:hypothetical protein